MVKLIYFSDFSGSQATIERDLKMQAVKLRILCLSFADFLTNLLFESLERTDPMTAQQRLGEEIFNMSEQLKKTNMDKWVKWIQKRTHNESIASNSYQDWLRDLKDRAELQIHDIKENIPEMFFQICKALGLPAELLDRDNLVELLSNVICYTIQLSDELSDELASTNPLLPEFLEKLKTYKQIGAIFCKLQFDTSFFTSQEELQSFFERIDEKLLQSGKERLHAHNFSSIMSLFISTDFVTSGYLSPLPPSQDFLLIMIESIIHHSCIGKWEEWFRNRDIPEANLLVEELRKIFEEIRKHQHFSMATMKLNVLCKLFRCGGFTRFLKLIRTQHPDEHEFICSTLRDMAESIQKSDVNGMDAHYARVLSHYPSHVFEANGAQILEIVCAQLSIDED